MESGKMHILRTNLLIFTCFCLLSIISPPRYDAVSQTTNKPTIPGKIKDVSQKYDSSNFIINRKLDSLQLNTDKLEKGTDVIEQTTILMKRQGIELKKHAKIIKEIDNKLKYDSLQLSDKNKLDLAKKKDEVFINGNIIGLPCIEPVKEERKGFFKRIFHWSKR